MNTKKLELSTKLELGDLLKAIDYLGNSISSGDDIHSYSKSPIHVLVHNEILKYSKEEIDSCQEQLRFGRNLFNVSFGIRNSYIFSAFLKIGAFQDKLSDESKWILKTTKNPSNDLYNLVYLVEEEKRHNKNNNPSYPDTLFDCMMNHYLDKFNTEEKLDVFRKYFKDFGKKMEKHFIHYVFEHHGRRSELCSYIIVNLKKNKVDLSQNDLLNRYLPKKESWHSKNTDFFISTTDIPKIKLLLNCGFRFDEKNYSYQGDNLFIAAIKSGRTDIIKTIIPTLSDITPKSGTLHEQNAFIDSLGTKVGNSTDQEDYNLIKTIYQKCLLDHELGLQSHNTETKRKLKI